MNILFSVGFLKKELNTTAKLVCEISNVLTTNEGHNCVLAGITEGEPFEEYLTPKIKLIGFNKPKNIHNAIRDYKIYLQSGKSKIGFIAKHPIKAFLVQCSYNNNLNFNYSQFIQKIVKCNGINAIFCVQDPIWAVKMVLKNKMLSSLPNYIYQMDPWGLYDDKSGVNSYRTVFSEIKAIKQAEKVFTTPILYDLYSKNKNYLPYLSKIKSVEFPGLKKPDCNNGNDAVIFDDNYINIVYSGSITGIHRSPYVFLKIIEEMILDNKKIRCYFYGDIINADIDSYRSRYPDNFFVYDYVAPDKLSKILSQADFLLNIGNVYSNMVPSKIIEYFAYGKPIINLQKIKKCPSKSYFDRYPLTINIKEFNAISTNEFYNKLVENKGETIDFETVEKIFEQATPAFVTKVISDCLG